MTTEILYNGFSDEQLTAGIKKLEKWVEKTMAGIEPKHLVRTQALTDSKYFKDANSVERETIRVALTFTTKLMALELMKKEQFRRTMENSDEIE